MSRIVALVCAAVLVALALSNAALAARLRPVVLMHGVTRSASSMDDVADRLREELPGITVINMEVGNGALDSVFMDMNKQVETFCENVKKHPELANGFNLIGFSQGTLITRGYIQRCNNPPVFNYISWAGPQAGQFGTPYLDIPMLDQLLAATPYLPVAQDAVSAAQYWKDPFNIPEYLSKSKFLADLNNERPQKNTVYRERLSSLNQMVLVYSTADEIIHPRESGWFSFFEDGQQKKLVPLRESRMYAEDWLGLRALDETGRLQFFQTDCKHGEHAKEGPCFEYFDDHTLPFLNNTLPN